MKTRIIFILLALASTACAPTQAVDMKVTATLPQQAFPTATFSSPTETPTSAQGIQPPACTFPLAEITAEESTTEEYTFSEPFLIL